MDLNFHWQRVSQDTIRLILRRPGREDVVREVSPSPEDRKNQGGNVVHILTFEIRRVMNEMVLGVLQAKDDADFKDLCP